MKHQCNETLITDISKVVLCFKYKSSLGFLLTLNSTDTNWSANNVNKNSHWVFENSLFLGPYQETFQNYNQGLF